MIRPAEILLVEDNPGDADRAREALAGSTIHNTLNVAGDGEGAMACLRREGRHAAVSRPDLILLDLDLPKKDGREVLAEIKGDEGLWSIPAVFLPTSRAEEDILRSYTLHANCHISKPIDLGQFLKVVKSIEDFWLSIVVLPSQP